jgi:hypothetical protein
MTQCFVSVLLVWIKFQVHNLSNFFLTTDRGGGGVAPRFSSWGQTGQCH